MRVKSLLLALGLSLLVGKSFAISFKVEVLVMLQMQIQPSLKDIAKFLKMEN